MWPFTSKPKYDPRIAAAIERNEDDQDFVLDLIARKGKNATVTASDAEVERFRRIQGRFRR